jgi:hypothetical protein
MCIPSKTILRLLKKRIIKFFGPIVKKNVERWRLPFIKDLQHLQRSRVEISRPFLSFRPSGDVSAF